MTWLRKHSTSVAITAIILLALGLRLVNIRAEELWYDEVLNTAVARSAPNFSALWHNAQLLFHPPLFFILIRWWTAWFSFSALSVRTFALVFSLATILALWEFTRRAFGQRTAFIAALLMAISPLAVEFGQEGRPYSLIGLLGLFSFWAFLSLRGRRPWLAMALLTATNVLGSALHADFVYILALEGVLAAVLWWRKSWPSPKKTAVLCAAALIISWGSFAFFNQYVITQAHELRSLENISQGVAPLPASIVAPFFIEPPQPISGLGNGYLRIVQLAELAGWLGLALIIGALFINPRADDKWTLRIPKLEAGERFVVLALVTFSLAGPLLFLLSPTSALYTMFWQRHIMSFGFAAIVLLAWAIVRAFTDQKTLAYLGCALVFIGLAPFLIRVLLNDSAFDTEHQAREFLRIVASEQRSGDLIIAIGMPTFRYYAPTERVTIPIISYTPVKGYDPFSSSLTDPSPTPLELNSKLALDPSTIASDPVGQMTRGFSRLWFLTPGQPDLGTITRIMQDWRLVGCGGTTEQCRHVLLFERR